MKKNKLFTLSFIRAVFMCSALLGYGQSYKKVTKTEMEFMEEYLEASLNHTREALSAVEDELWNYQPKNGGWSIAQCVDHIYVAERGILQGMKKSLEEAVDESKRSDWADGLVIGFVSDRGKVAVTPLSSPEVRMSKEEYLTALEQSRDEIKSFVKGNEKELRNHFGNAPFGVVDTYQLALVAAGHGMRHTAQIKQIIAEYRNEPVEY